MSKADIDWMRKEGAALSLLGEAVADLLGSLYQGIYHIDRSALFHKRTNWSATNHIEIVLWGQFSTFDGDRLTQLVFLAHDRCLRVTVAGAGSGYLRITFHPKTREGNSFDRHPTIEQALEKWQSSR